MAKARSSAPAQIKRVLIANRGEIACRIIRTCHQMGIETVAVFSDPDALSLHAELATQAVALGGSDTAQSYLRGDRIIAAALESGADAIHPGYGFLSENAAFARAVAKAGLIFVGPSPQAMERLGDKLAAKKLAQSVKVPLAPSVELRGAKARQLKEGAEFCRKVGYPVMVKAAAGGGGRGMREVRQPGELAAALESAAQEASRLFGNGSVFLEKIIRPARHLEVQIAADTAGNVVVLGDRDCTWQRQNQKLIEEAPAPGLPPQVRKALHTAALRLAKAAQYTNVGTAEFLFDGRGKIFFMEVNSRLQVEHTVTEAVTGLDLVELQIALARGETLPQRKVNRTPKPSGHAIQARLCAERILDGKVVTSTGRIARCILPTAQRSKSGLTRVDSGVREGDQITHWYDSLIAKLIVCAGDRKKSIQRLISELQSIEIEGVEHNTPLLLRLVGDPRFHAVRHTITLLNEDPSFSSRQESSGALLAAAVFLVEESVVTHNPLRLGHIPQARWYRVGDEYFRCDRSPLAGALRISGASLSQEISLLGEEWVLFEAGRAEFEVQYESKKFSVRSSGAGRWTVSFQGRSVLVLAATPRPDVDSPSSKTGSGTVRSPLPGKVLRLDVKKGVRVSEGDTLLVLESMKMEHPVRSPLGGMVQAVHVASGETVAADALLVEIR